jgi:hypothetical protein
MALALRPRSKWEGCDLGVRLLQSQLNSVFACHLTVAVPLFAAILATYQLSPWLPSLLLWLAKPWLDRTILFALSRALFGERTTPRVLWQAQREVWWRDFAMSFTLRRMTASRALTQPVLQLEGLAGAPLRVRLRQITARHRGVARLMSVAFAAAEFAIIASIFSLQVWLVPHATSDFSHLFTLSASAEGLVTTLGFAVAILFVEPFYVAAGFGMYLNRRVELEAWDIEQEFRRAFAS